MPYDADILISGASFAGLALASALSAALRGEARIAIVDRADAGGGAADDIRASAVALGSVRILQAIGVWRHVADLAQPVTAIDITDGHLDSPARPVFLGYDNHADGEPATVILPNQLLQQALADGVAADPAIEIVRGDGVVGYGAGKGHATVTLGSGRTLAAPLVVAADGRRSALREAAGIKTVGWTYAQTGIVTTVGHQRPHGGKAVQHFLPAGPFAILPLAGGMTSSLVWSEDETRVPHLMALDDVAFLAEVEQRFGGRLGRLRLAGPRAAFPLEMHIARRLVADRLALVGDSARVMHPIAGQGLNMALRDVAALTEVTVGAMRVGLDFGGAETLLRYERWRRFDSVVSAGAFDTLNRLFSNDVALVRAARDFGLGLVERAPELKRLLVAEAAGLMGERPKLLDGVLP